MEAALAVVAYIVGTVHLGCSEDLEWDFLLLREGDGIL